MDMEGNIVKEWRSKNYIVLLNNGNILAVNMQNKAIGKYHWNNDIIWEREDIKIHHEIVLSHSDTIITISNFNSFVTSATWICVLDNVI